MTDEIELYKRRYEREKKAREQAEELLETKSAELYRLNEALTNLTSELEQKVLDRTLEFQKARDLAIANNEAKSVFLANMSHEIRTPMNGILGVVYLLESSDLSEHQRHLLKTAKESGELLLAIINDILDVSKIEAGELTLEHIQFDLTDLIQKVTDTFSITAQQKQLALVCAIDPNIPRLIEGDPTRVRQVLYNLINNALKFTQQGTITVCATAADTNLIEISVSDTGIGIAANKLTDIFSPFTQADDSITRKFGGTGLGLAICAHLTKVMGKAIQVSSTLGKGSTFTFWLDTTITNENPEQTGGASAELPPRFTDHLIMLVDDNPVNREIGSEILREQGFTVDCFENGELALNAITHKDYCAVLMDVQMPVMDGLTATRQIRALGGRHSHTPIIAMTAHARREDIERSLNAGMNAHLTKPIEPQKIFALLAQWIARNAPHATPEEIASAQRHSTSAPLQTNNIIHRDQPTSRLHKDDFKHIDIEEALGRTSNNHELLHKVFGMFITTHKDDGNKFTTFLDAQNFIQIQLAAHKLKGSSGSIGAKKLFAAASNLEKACKDHDYSQCESLVEKTKTALNRTIQELEKIPTSKPTTKIRALSDADLKRKINEFIATSQSDLVAAEKVLKDILAIAPDSDLAHQIIQHFDHFEIEAIYPLLERLLPADTSTAPIAP